jgi:hypothetical protein
MISFTVIQPLLRDFSFRLYGAKPKISIKCVREDIKN